jgi:hypothetical protein
MTTTAQSPSEQLWDAARDRITETNQAVAAERERIRHLAIEHDARYQYVLVSPCSWCGRSHRSARTGSFADLIGDPAGVAS